MADSDTSTSAADIFAQHLATDPKTELSSFLASHGLLELHQLAEVVRVDQRHRWRQRKPILCEVYFGQFPALRNDADTALDLIVNECIVRAEVGESIALEEYLARFPELGEPLKDQIELFLSMHNSQTTVTDYSRPTLAPNSRLAARDYQPGESFGRYEIERLLGTGGMGQVYLARDSMLDRQIALKIPKADLANDSGWAARFRREARIAARVTHPMLCSVLDVGELDGQPFLTMPLVEGETLAQHLRQRGALPAPAAIRIAQSLAEAMAHAHRSGVIHRDLKSANVMLRPNGDPVIMDFGLARQANTHDPRLTESGAIVGTVAYMAPEQMEGSGLQSPTIDIYSLGVIFYEMLTGALPFIGNQHQIAAQRLTKKVPPPSTKNSVLGSEVDAVCLKALAKDPAQRYRTMEEFSAALKTLPTSTHRPPSRWKWAIAAAALPVLALLIGIALSFVPAKPPNTPPGGLPPPAEPLPTGPFDVGTHWSGHFRWKGDTTPHTAEIVVESRDGPKMQARYMTENRQFVFKLEGDVAGNTMNTKITQALEGGVDSAKGATIRGSVVDDELNADYSDHDSAATLKLKRQHPAR